MFLIANGRNIRESLVSELQLPVEHVFSEFPFLPFPGHLIVGIDDIQDKNLRLAIRCAISNADKDIVLIIVKFEWQHDDERHVDDIVRAEYRQAYESNQAHINHINSRLSDASDWKSERLTQLNKWRTIPTIDYSCLTFNEHLKAQVDKLTSKEFDSDDINSELSSKPPVLHWTPEPFEGEIQFIVQLKFSICGPDMATFRKLCRSFKSYAESTYEWDGGILILHDPARVHLRRTSLNVIELAARVCIDELDEPNLAMNIIWEHMCFGLRNALEILAEHKFMQYSITFVPFSSFFYFDGKEHARVFDAVVFCSTADRFKMVAFKSKYAIHKLRIDHVFPNGVPKSMEDLLEKYDTPKSRSKDMEQVVAESTIPKSRFTSSPHTSLNVPMNQGRRVSFGSIKLITDDKALSKEGLLPFHENTGSEQSKVAVEDYVDQMLQNTIEQLNL